MPWAGHAARPFCSVTCKLIDLGAWLDETYRVAGEPGASEANLSPDADGPRPDNR